MSPTLNAGCGARPSPNSINIDIDLGSKADVICDLEALPFESNLFSKIVCNHVLEHLAEDMWRDKAGMSRAVLEFSRVLRDDGVVEIEVPSPQGQDAVRGDHLTVYGHKRLTYIFGFYFESVKCWGVGTWFEAWGFHRIFARWSKIDPFWGNAYGFVLSRSRKITEIVRY